MERKVKHQGLIPENRFSEILDLEYVRFDTTIESIAGLQPEMSKVIWKSVWPWVSRSIVKITCLFSTFLISSISKMFESTLRLTSYHIWNQRYEKSCKKVFDLDLQGQTSMSGDWFWAFWDPRPWNVRINTKVKSASCIQSELMKVTQWMCVTLSAKGNRQGHGIALTFLISLTSKMLESTPRSTLYHVCNRRYERSCKKVFDLDFQGHAMRIEYFHYHRWIP